jgi:hypothetical protein
MQEQGDSSYLRLNDCDSQYACCNFEGQGSEPEYQGFQL